MNTRFSSFLLDAIGRAKHDGVVEARTLNLDSDQDHKRIEANATQLLLAKGRLVVALHAWRLRNSAIADASYFSLFVCWKRDRSINAADRNVKAQVHLSVQRSLSGANSEVTLTWH